MRKIYLFLLPLLTLALFGCETNDYISARDSQFSTELSVKGFVSEGETNIAYIQKPLECKVYLKSDASQTYPIRFTITHLPETDCNGELKLTNTDEVIAPRESAYYTSKITEDVLTFNYTPTSVGTHKVTISVSNGFITKKVTIDFEGKEPAFNVDFTGLPLPEDKDSIDVERPTSFGMQITELYAQTDKPQTIKATAKFIKGEGSISTTVAGKSVVLGKSVAGKEGEPITLAEGTPEELGALFTGNNAMTIESDSWGDNEIEFTLENETGIKQTVPLSVKSKYPDFEIAATALSDKAYAGSGYTVRVNVDNFEHPTNTEFDIYYEIVNTGTQSQTVSTYSVPTSATLSEPIPTRKFLKTIKAEPIQATAITGADKTGIPGGIQVTYAANKTATDDSELGVAKPNTAGIISDTVLVPIKSEGSQRIRLIAIDKFNEYKDKFVTLNAGASQLAVTFDQASPVNSKYNEPSDLDLNIYDTDLRDKYTVSYTITGGTGTLAYAGQPIEPGKETVIQSTSKLTFTPSSVGTITLNFTVSSYKGDVISEVKTIEVIFKVSYDDIKVTLPEEEITGGVNQPIQFVYTAKEQYYEGDFELKYERINGAGKLSTPTVNEVKHGDILPVKSEIPVNFTYLPTSAGTHELHFTTKDIYGQSVLNKVRLNIVDSPLDFRVSTMGQLKTGQETPFTITMSKEYYSGTDFSVTYTATEGRGTFKQGSSEIQTNGNFTIRKDIPISFSYTPLVAGHHVLTLNTTIDGKVIPNKIELDVPVYITTSVTPENGGTLSGEGTYDYNSSVQAEAVPATGYALEGIYAGEQKVSSGTAYTFPATEDMALQARFVIQKFTLTVNSDPSAGGSVEGAGEYEYNTSTTVRATANEGYRFVRWEKDGQEVSTQTEYTFNMPAQNTTLTAIFEQSEYELTINTQGQGTVTGAGKYSFNESVSATANPAEGYHFAKWLRNGNDAGTSNPYQFRMPSEPLTLTAVFDPNEYRISVNVIEGGTVSGDGVHKYGSTATLVATASPGYIFEGFYDGEERVSGSSTYSFTVGIGDKTLTAKFKPNTFTITVISGSGGTATGSGTFPYGEERQITATPDEGHVFVEWQDANGYVSKDNPYTITVEKNITYTAIFDVGTYSLNVSGTTGGSVQGGGPCKYGSSQTITAIAQTGYSFSHWEKNGQYIGGTPTMQIIIGTTNNYVAHFTINRHTLTVQGEGLQGANVSVTGGGTYDYGSNVNLTSSCRDTFLGWFLNGSSSPISTSKNYSVTVTGDASYVARYRKDNIYISATGGTTANGFYATASADMNVPTNVTVYCKIQYVQNGFDYETTISVTIPAGSRTATAEQSNTAVQGGSISGLTTTATGTSPTSGGNYKYVTE